MKKHAVQMLGFSENQNTLCFQQDELLNGKYKNLYFDHKERGPVEALRTLIILFNVSFMVYVIKFSDVNIFRVSMWEIQKILEQVGTKLCKSLLKLI